MSKQAGARVQLRWRDGDLETAAAIHDRWGQPAPDWYWLDPVPVLPLPGPQTPAPWGAGLPELHGHEPRELRLFWEGSAIHLVRQAAGRYRWVELAEASEPAAIGTEGRKRVSDWFRRPKETSEAPPSVSADWRTIAVTRRWQPVLLRPSIPARGRFAIIQYLADNRVLFWRLGWTASASEPGGALNTIGGD
jgi:hypothetical protein